MYNVLSARTTWARLHNLSAALTNAHVDDPLVEGFVWVADSSIGGREWEAGQAVDHVDNGFGCWLGFEEAGSTRFWWQSASSEATIEARLNPEGEWVLTFVGTGIDSHRGESQYGRVFAEAAIPKTVQVDQEGNLYALKEVCTPDPSQVYITDLQRARLKEFIHSLRMHADLTELEATLDEDERLLLDYGFQG
ncbi:MAG: hypothetical protein WCW16_03075 [Candidatus Magasanikbacteria bacterium]